MSWDEELEMIKFNSDINGMLMHLALLQVGLAWGWCTLKVVVQMSNVSEWKLIKQIKVTFCNRLYAYSIRGWCMFMQTWDEANELKEQRFNFGALKKLFWLVNKSWPNQLIASWGDLVHLILYSNLVIVKLAFYHSP